LENPSSFVGLDDHQSPPTHRKYLALDEKASNMELLIGDHGDSMRFMGTIFSWVCVGAKKK
jgi:hypothetical protein